MRDDYLVSVCIVDDDGSGESVKALTALNATLARGFRYFEIVYVIAERKRGLLDVFAGPIASLPNLRILVTDDGISFYHQRAMAASEAIGDVVAIVDPADLDGQALIDRLNEAKDHNQVLLGWRSAAGAGRAFYAALSFLSRNAVTAQASRTIILPRERLNGVLARGRASLDLRFEPRRGSWRYQRFPLPGTARTQARLAHRYELLTEILLSGAPRHLKIYAGFGMLVSLSAGFYSIYAVAVAVLGDGVQEGWLSTALALSGSTGFIAVGMSIISIALAAMLENAAGRDDRIILEEIANISFFDRLTERNVQFGHAPDEDSGGRR